MKETGIIMAGNHPLSGYVTASCQNCGRRRRVQLLRGKPRRKLCRHCGRLGYRHSSETIAKLSGENSSSWKGGRQNCGHGYITVKLQPSDFFYPMADKRGYVLEHRLIVAKAVGRCLQSWELVHHRGQRYTGIENRSDNRYPQNLELTIRGSHAREHSKGYRDGYQQGYQDAQREVRSERLSDTILN